MRDEFILLGKRGLWSCIRYLLGMVPSNVLVTRLRPAWYLSGWMMAWAVVSTLTCLVKDYHGMLASRSVLRGSDKNFACPDLALKNRPWFH